MPLQIRRGTNAERVAMTQPLAAGELLWITDDQRLYVGNGSTLPSSLVSITGYTNANAQDAAATLFTTGTHRSISFAYNDSLNRIDATVDLSAYNGPIDGDLIGSVFSDNSTRLIDGTSGKINLNGTIGGHVIPDQNSVYDLGSNANKFRDLYLSGSTIFLGSASITSTGSVVNLPAGSTVNGVLIGSGTGAGDGVIEGSTYKINIAADDSSIMLNSDLETVTASGGFFGNLTGNVTGNVNGVITGTTGSTLTGNVTGNINGVVTGTAGSSLVGNVTGNLLGNVTGNVLGNVTGNVLGNVTGDVKGSLFADNSSMLVDGTNGRFFGTIDTGDAILNRDGIISAAGFSMGSASTLLDLTLNLSNNLQIRQLVNPSNPKGYITISQSRGSISSPTAVQTGDELGGLLFRAFSNTTTPALAGNISVIVADDAVISGGNYVKSVIALLASSDTAQDEANAFILDSAGVATSNAFEASKYFQLPVFANTGARDTAVPVPVPGMMVFITGTGMQIRGATGWNTIAGTAT